MVMINLSLHFFLVNSSVESVMNSSLTAYQEDPDSLIPNSVLIEVALLAFDLRSILSSAAVNP